MVSAGWQTCYRVLLLCLSSSRCLFCPLHTRTPGWRLWEWRFLTLVQTCVVASRAKAVWELEVPKEYQSYSDDSICYFFTLQEIKGVYQNVVLRKAEILYIKSCYYELLRMFSSFLMLNIICSIFIVDLQWVTDLQKYSSFQFLEWPSRADQSCSLLAGCSFLCLPVYMCVTVFSVLMWYEKERGSIELIYSNTQIIVHLNISTFILACDYVKMYFETLKYNLEYCIYKQRVKNHVFWVSLR